MILLKSIQEHILLVKFHTTINYAQKLISRLFLVVVDLLGLILIYEHLRNLN